MKKTEIEIISGFLGCGKTTFIKKIISESEDFSNTVILENEFGEVSIDGEILQREGVKIKEINAGCICCSVAGDFAKSLIEIKDMFDPDKIIIEPSGVGKLSEIISICNKYPETFQLNKIITILDLKNFLMFLTNFGEFYIDQIENANMIIFSRFTDAVNSGTDLVDIENKIREINPKVNIISKEWDNFSIEDLFVEKKKMKKLDMFSHHHHHHHHEDGHCCHCSSENKESNNDFESITIAINNEISRETLTNILNDFESGKYGSIIRSKGSVPNEKGSLQFDYVPGEIRINDKPCDTKCHVVIIGENLDREALEKLFL
ncbi:CobW family GTP-binding protein [Peptostreptococcus porci]|uniref:CobW family GTP-binding protein n=1 Tax=Peptostreptococcus porci TaxID=2652282 RepID=UPI0023F0A8ED|nr:CobW family GTP-binding protein [Peptostreptococcus porci]MDD7182582.1 GTP-binding protein [Peptostreptococcus porci]MDY5964880.1 CobW family GTP-binding protein [Peptostreptococcus porci]